MVRCASLVLFLSLTTSSLVFAQNAEEQSEFPLPGGVWRVVVETGPPRGEYHSTRIEVRSDTTRQLLSDSEATAPADAYVVRPRPDGFVITYPCGNRFAPEGQTCTDVYQRRATRWRRISRRTHSPWQRAMHRYDQALRRGRIDEARAILATTGTSPNAGHTDEADALFEKMFAAVVRVARADARRGNIALAAGRIADLLRHPPMTNVQGSDEGWLRLSSEGGFNQLEPTPDNLARVGHAESILRRAQIAPDRSEQLRQQRAHHVDPREWNAVRRWFRLRERGVPPLPPTLMVDARPASRDEFLAFLDHDVGNGSTAFHLTPWARPRALAATPSPPGTRAITVAPDACAPHLECEGYAIAEFFFDADGDLAAINLTATD